MGERFGNVYPVIPGLRDPNASMPTFTEFLYGGERRVHGAGPRFDGEQVHRRATHARHGTARHALPNRHDGHGSPP